MAIVYDRLTVTNNNNTSAINTNFQRIEEAMAEALGTEGRTPNSMNADIDLNSNDLLNVGTIGATTVTATTTTTDTLNATTIFIDGEELDVDGITGPVGPAGATGANGVGISVGGTTNQVLVKVDGTDYNTTWTDTLTNKTLTSPTVQATNGVALTGTQSLSAANAQSIFDLGVTWNTSGTPTALKLNVTDTASNAASLLADFQVGGSSKLKINKAGDIITSKTGTSTAPHVYAGANSLVIGGNSFAVVTALSEWAFRVQSSTVEIHGNRYLSFSPDSGAGDLRLYRDAAYTLAQRHGTNAQTKRLYFSYTDASNYTRMAFKTATGIHTIETESAGTGEANIDLALTPKGTGAIRFGTHSAIGAETVTGYITIKDAGGTSRKIAVVS